jgi:hypothetical protein
VEDPAFSRREVFRAEIGKRWGRILLGETPLVHQTIEFDVDLGFHDNRPIRCTLPSQR